MRFNFVFDNAELFGGVMVTRVTPKGAQKSVKSGGERVVVIRPSPTIPSNAMQRYSTMV